MQIKQLQTLISNAQLSLNSALKSDIWASCQIDESAETKIQQALELIQLANIQIKRNTNE